MEWGKGVTPFPPSEKPRIYPLNNKHKTEMTEHEKCKIAKERGFKYDSQTGHIIGVNGKP